MAWRQQDPRIDVLRTIEGLRNCTPKELSALAAVMDELRVEAGEHLLRVGSGYRQAWLVLDGHVEVSAHGRSWLAGPGALVGDLGFLGAVPSVTSAVAFTDLRVLAFDRRAVDAIVCVPDAARWVCAQLALQLRAALDAPAGRRTRALAAATA